MSFLRRLLAKECPECHRLFDKSQIDKHRVRHLAGRTSWATRTLERPAFTRRPIGDLISQSSVSAHFTSKFKPSKEALASGRLTSDTFWSGSTRHNDSDSPLSNLTPPA